MLSSFHVWRAENRDDAVEKCRATEDGDFVIKLARAVLAVPGLATVIVALVKLLDRYGLSRAWNTMCPRSGKTRDSGYRTTEEMNE